MSRSFEGIEALSDIDLELAPGEVLGLIGPYGAARRRSSAGSGGG